jgi:hypothetical protein
MHPPAVVVDDRITSHKLFATTRERRERRPLDDVDDISSLSEEYQTLMASIRGE